MSQATVQAASGELFAYQLSVQIQAPPDLVFAYVSAIERHPEWAANPLTIQHVAGPTTGPGATFTSVAHRTARVAGTFTGRIRILDVEAPRRLVYRVEDTSGQYHWTFTLTPEAGGTHVVHRMGKLGGPWLINMVQPGLIWPLIGKHQVWVGLQNLKSRLEIRHEPSR